MEKLRTEVLDRACGFTWQTGLSYWSCGEILLNWCEGSPICQASSFEERSLSELLMWGGRLWVDVMERDVIGVEWILSDSSWWYSTLVLRLPSLTVNIRDWLATSFQSFTDVLWRCSGQFKRSMMNGHCSFETRQRYAVVPREGFLHGDVHSRQKHVKLSSRLHGGYELRFHRPNSIRHLCGEWDGSSQLCACARTPAASKKRANGDSQLGWNR